MNYLNINNDIDKICEYSQYNILNPINNTNINIENINHNELNTFLSSKPKIDEEGNIITHSFTSKTSNNLYSKSLWIKMKNQKLSKKSKFFIYINQ